MTAFIRKFPVLTFVILTLGFQLAIVLIAYSLMPAGKHLHELPDAHMIFRFRVFGPLLFAVGITYYLEGRAGFKKLFKSFFHWKVAPQWYLLGFGWKFMFTYLGIGVAVLLGITFWPGFIVPDFISGTGDGVIHLMKNMPFIVGIAIVEETAWMKFSVTRLQDKYSAFVSCAIIGICWGLWYLPMLLLGEGVPDGIPWPFFMLSMFSLTILLGWTYNMTRSGLVLLIMQIISNCAFFILPVLPGWWDLNPVYVISFVCANFSMAMLIVMVYGPKELSHGTRAKWSESTALAH